MRKFIILSIIACFLGFISAHCSVPINSVQAQQQEAKVLSVKDEPAPAKANDPTVRLSQEEIDLLQSAIDKGNADTEQAQKNAQQAIKLAEETARSRSAEVRALYLEIKEKYKDKLPGNDWEVVFDKQKRIIGWAPKAQTKPAAAPATQPK